MMLNEAFYRLKQSDIQARVDADGLDGLLILDAHNVTYASGFHHIPSERPIGLYIPKMGEAILFVPLLERENAASAHVRDVRFYFEYPGETHPIAWMLDEVRGRRTAVRIGVDTLTADVMRRLPCAVELSDIVERMRWIKSPDEIALVQVAATYADYCLDLVRDHAPAIIRDGGTELDILKHALGLASAKLRSEVGELFRLHGGAIVGTVHSGERAALPHGSPLARTPKRGEPLIAGIGANVGGYHAESGATFVVGEPTRDVMRHLQIAAEVDRAATLALRAGATCAEVNAAAMEVYIQYGLMDYIRHRIGHGMGLQAHESPWLAPGDSTVLQPGMVFSNEPGIYRPGVDGYRTINTMIVTDDLAFVPRRFLRDNPLERRILAL
jgi:Xaa-Pro aminopeptidase